MRLQPEYPGGIFGALRRYMERGVLAGAQPKEEMVWTRDDLEPWVGGLLRACS